MTTKKQRTFAAVAIAAAGVGVLSLSACGSKPADVVSTNLSNAADNFQIYRDVSFVDTVTNTDMVTVDGLCSLGNNDTPPYITVTCKTGTDAKGNGEYVKDIFIVTGTTAVAAVQPSAAHVNDAHYSITWNPGTLIPTFNKAGNAPLTGPAAQTPTAKVSLAQTAKPKVVVVPVAPVATPSPTNS